MDVRKSFVFLLIIGLNVWIQPAICKEDVQVELKRLEQQLFNLRQTMVDQEQKILQQQADIQNLRGSNEVLTHTLEQIRKQQQDIYVDLDKRLRQMQSNQSDAPQFSTELNTQVKPVVPTESQAVAVPNESQGVASTQNGSLEPTFAAGGEEQLYQSALTLLREYQYSESIKNFQEILARYPQGKYADNAQYWIGESHYALKEFDRALDAFNRVLNFYPNSSKRAHALLKIGYVYYEMGDYTAAKAILEQVRDTYQNTESARLAEQRLQKMHSQGL